MSATFRESALRRAMLLFLRARESGRDHSLDLQTLTPLLAASIRQQDDPQTLRWLQMFQEQQLTASPRFLMDLVELLDDASWRRPSFSL